MRVCINNAYYFIRALNYSVPQESEANFFIAYCALIEFVIPAGITFNGFADHHSIRRSFSADS